MMTDLCPQTKLLQLKFGVLLPAAAVLGLLLTGCASGGLFEGNMMYAPHRAVESDAATLQSAIAALAEGDQQGQILLSETEVASLLRALLVDEADPERRIRDVRLWLEPDTVYLQVLLREGTLQAVPTGIALNLEAGLRTVEGRLLFDLRRAGVGVIPIVSPALLDQIESQLDVRVGRLLDRTSPLRVDVRSGEIAIDVP